MSIILTLLILCIIVVLHEWGHFIVAKMLNFKVRMEFSVGMGPAIFKKKKGETQYSIRILPLGGYCKFEAKMKPTIPIRELFKSKSMERLLVLLAGGVFNIILGFVLFLVIVPSTSPARTMLLIRLFRTAI